MIYEAAGYGDGRIGWILSAVEMKRGTQEMETAVSREFHLPLSALRRFYLLLCFLLCTTHNSKSHAALLKFSIKIAFRFSLISCMGSPANCLVLLVITLDRWPEMLQNLTLQPAGYQ
jgi:hypothetical protein